MIKRENSQVKKSGLLGRKVSDPKPRIYEDTGTLVEATPSKPKTQAWVPWETPQRERVCESPDLGEHMVMTDEEDAE